MTVEKDGNHIKVNGVSVDSEQVGIEIIDYLNGYYDLYLYNVINNAIIDNDVRWKLRGIDAAFNQASLLFTKLKLNIDHFKYTESTNFSC